MTIKCGKRSGTVDIPSSKSISHRIIIASLLSDVEAKDELVRGWSDDLKATRDCLTAILGGKESKWHCRESGTTLRLLEPIAGVLDAKGEFVCEGRLGSRPRMPFEKKEVYELPGDISSQFVSGLLLALPLASWDSEIKLTSPLQSQAYVKLTEDALLMSKIKFTKSTDGMSWRIPGNQKYQLEIPPDCCVEGDWSQAAFFLAMNSFDDGSEAKGIIVRGLNMHSNQGDMAVLELLGKDEIDVSQVPDLVLALAAHAAGQVGKKTIFSNCERLRLKECDRLEATKSMIEAVGGQAEIDDFGSSLSVYGKKLSGGEVKSCGDHRIAMAAAVLATWADGDVELDDPRVVSKSYPEFWNDFNCLARREYEKVSY